MTRKPKWAWVVDQRDSALGISAIERAKHNREITVYFALDYPEPIQLLRKISRDNNDVMFFSWRFLLLELLTLKSTLKELLRFQEKTGVIGILIPDHIGLENLAAEKELELLFRTDFHMVTSKKLSVTYGSKQSKSIFMGVIHDLPNLDLIRLISHEVTHNKESNSYNVIWVGNSQWGNKLGYLDHKRFKSIVKPVEEYFILNSDLKISLRIVDSASKRIKNSEVVRLIKESDLLIQTSSAEGTGIPLLEALGVGTEVLTTSVGIAEEILGSFPSRILSPDPEIFRNKIIELSRGGRIAPEKLQKQFFEFIRKCLGEELPLVISRGEFVSRIESTKVERTFLLFRWYARFTVHKFRSIKFLSGSKVGK